MQHSWTKVPSAPVIALALLGIGCSDSVIGIGRAGLVLRGHMECEEHGALEGDFLYFDRLPFLDCDYEWWPARWTYQRRPPAP